MNDHAPHGLPTVRNLLIFTPAYKSGNIYDTNEYIVAMGPT
jgi:hypothetical protein